MGSRSEVDGRHRFFDPHGSSESKKAKNTNGGKKHLYCIEDNATATDIDIMGIGITLVIDSEIDGALAKSHRARYGRQRVVAPNNHFVLLSSLAYDGDRVGVGRDINRIDVIASAGVQSERRGSPVDLEQIAAAAAVDCQ